MLFINSLMFLLVLGIITVAIISIFKRRIVSGVKVMLLGLSIILSGGIIAVDPSSSFGGIEYLIVLVGLIISIVGFGKVD